MHDMFIGGVTVKGEDQRGTAMRETLEEVNLGNSDSMSEEVFECAICTSVNRCLVSCYEYDADIGDVNIKFRDGEVSWGDWIAIDEVVNAVEDGKLGGGRVEFVDDGLQVWKVWRERVWGGEG